MELEKLKEIWTSLDDRMQQQEGLKTVIIKEMLLSKSDKALSRLINYSYFGIVLIISVIPLFLWAFRYAHTVLRISLFWIVFVLVIWILVGGVYGLIKLHKIDFSKSLSSNITVISKYKMFYKRGTVITCSIGALALALCFVDIFLSQQGMELWRLVAVITAIPIAIVGSYWEYKRMGMRNINSILNSLEELKELEEPDEK